MRPSRIYGPSEQTSWRLSDRRSMCLTFLDGFEASWLDNRQIEGKRGLGKNSFHEIWHVV